MDSLNADIAINIGGFMLLKLNKNSRRYGNFGINPDSLLNIKGDM